MRRALREHSRDVLAVVGLIVVGLVSTWVIVQNQRLRVPFVEETPYELKAELEAANTRLFSAETAIAEAREDMQFLLDHVRDQIGTAVT